MLLLGFFSMLFSCDTDYLYNTEIRIENASQHDIEIIVEKPSSEFLTGSVALKSGTTFTTKHSIDGKIHPEVVNKVIRSIAVAIVNLSHTFHKRLPEQLNIVRTLK